MLFIPKESAFRIDILRHSNNVMKYFLRRWVAVYVGIILTYLDHEITFVSVNNNVVFLDTVGKLSQALDHSSYNPSLHYKFHYDLNLTHIRR